MMWLMWRKHRTAWLTAAGLTAAVAVLAAIARPWIAEAVMATTPHTGLGLASTLSRVAAMVIPIAVGVFFGSALFAPDIENGTHLFALTQSVSRTRWYSTGIGLAIAASALVGAAWSAAFWWAWSPSISGPTGPSVDYATFLAVGAVPVVHSVLAVAVGAVLGLMLGRTWPTIALTITVCLGVRIALALTYTSYIRPTEFVAPMTLMGPSVERTSAVIENGWMHRDGTRVPYDGAEYTRIADDCFPANSALSPDTVETCVRESGITHDYARVYLPSDFWTLNLIESAITLSLTAAIVLLGLRWSSTRLA